MKKIIMKSCILILIVFFAACKKDGIDDDTSFLNSAVVTSTDKVFDISNDNSGNVKITPTGQGASSFIIQFGDGAGADAQAEVAPGYSATHAYPEGSYTVTIIAKSLSGKETSTTYPLQVTYRAPEGLDLGISQTVQYISVSPTAQYAASYLVYFGDASNEEATAVAAGGSANHTYPGPGTYTAKLVALSGGQARTEETYTITVTAAFGMPITFDDAGTDYFFGTFGTNQAFQIVNNPDPSGLNTSAKVGKFTRGEESWSGTYSPVNAIDFSIGKKIKVLAYNPSPSLVGKKMNVELEAGSVPNGVAVLKTAFTTSGMWEELEFDFSTITAIPADAKFSQLVLRFNDTEDGAGDVIYIDNFRLTN